MNKYLKAIDKLENEYDAYFVSNKYGENTHQKEFDLLKELKGEKVKNALAWIHNCYDCYYKNENDENGPFEYLRLCAKGVER